MADKPSRSLVLYGDGLARLVNPTLDHLHSFASRASCGFLSLPHAPSSGKIRKAYRLILKGKNDSTVLVLATIFFFRKLTRHLSFEFTEPCDGEFLECSCDLIFPTRALSNVFDYRHHCPMLVAQWQNAVTRKDMVKFFSFRDFNENGGILTIPADRFLHEVAFKLWKAPKYGA
ncbi:uncharacterized protein LOC111408392 [Olea europaea var. sylvestris]|uniref:uncharacterized protein LOC111408392 n=1 Tax=Olea europaea var. sylvestris TaxID=158386 RepID=UPI000C1D7A95|nr:uncharacterized protein LOC111408392 [Olea europaea var. sylvestris]